MFDLTNLIPQVAAAKSAIYIGLITALFSAGLYLGYQWGSKALPTAQLEQQIELSKVVAERTDITAASTIQYIDRVVKVREEARVIIQEVPKYVTDSCTLSPNLRLFHDAAAKGQLPSTH